MSTEIQKFQAILSKHLTTSQKFVDEEFPPDAGKSIGGPYAKFPFRRSSEVLEQVAIFPKEIDPTDIKHGPLNDVYFLSAVATLAEEPGLVQRLFLTDEANRAGLYAVWLCKNGAWTLVLLDDFLPCRQHQGSYFQAFAQTRSGELWISLLEKAYAKVNGTYFNIESGYPHHVMRDLTGAPIEGLYDEADPEKLWEFICNGLDNENFLMCSTELEDDDYDADEQIKGHAYTILDAREVQSDRGTERLIMVRNPWDNFEWKGAWSNTSELWTPELRNELNYPEDEEENLFWMAIEDYQKYFPSTWVCKYKKDNNYYSVNFAHKNTNNNILRIKVQERQEVTISLNQRDRMAFRDSHPDYFYSYGRILLGKVEANGLEYITGNASGYERNLQATHVLEPGTYLLTIEVEWNQDFCRDFNVSFYTPGKLQIESLYEVDLLGVQKNIIKSALTKIENNKTVSKYGKYGDPQIKKTVDCIHGIFYFHYENRSTKKSKLCETVKFSQISNLKICSPFTNDNQFDVTVLPGSDLLVLYKAMVDDYSWAYSASFYIQTTSREDEKTPANVYTYIDDPDNKLKVEVNDNYNVYVKDNAGQEEQPEPKEEKPKRRESLLQGLGKRTQEPQKKAPTGIEDFEEDKEFNPDKYFEDNPREKGDQDPYYYFSEQQGGNRKRRQKDQNDSKKPKEFPLTVMEIGQTNSKKVKYTNHDNVAKQLVVTSTRPEIIQVKEPNLTVKPGQNADLRLRFVAPKDAGRYVVKLEIKQGQSSEVEEILQFPIEVRRE